MSQKPTFFGMLRNNIFGKNLWEQEKQHFFKNFFLIKHVFLIKHLGQSYKDELVKILSQNCQLQTRSYKLG
jgi:hypothetical protein